MQTMSIKELKSLMENEKNLTEDFLNNLAQDDRVGVQQIYAQLVKRRQKIALEEDRTQKMYTYEQQAQASGYQFIVGIDEVGRGPLAGPVVVAAVMLPTDERILGLNDSKKLSPEKRTKMAEIIKDKALCYAYGLAEAQEIDKINIYQATLAAMERAVKKLKLKADYLLIDAVKIPNINITQNSIVGGDGKSASIAAASILAKVYRDQLMEEYHEVYPQYGFKNHKGYGTKEHMAAIKDYGHSPIHRLSFKTQ